jgi:hypothetical protein
MPSVFSCLSSGDSPLVGPGFVEPLGLRPSFPMATLIAPDAPNWDPDSENSLRARTIVAEQAACGSSYSFPSLSPTVFVP